MRWKFWAEDATAGASVSEVSARLGEDGHPPRAADLVENGHDWRAIRAQV